ncbi:MAG: Ig-like protein, partial [Proteobacteria bacterium]|nr:Ig-like protein [Pseudomonadota bacterium]
MAQSQVIAKVSSINGEAFARDSAGKLRRLKVGDVVREGESVVAADGGQVLLTLADGREIQVRPGEVAKLDAEVGALDKPDVTDSAVADYVKGLEKVARVLATGGDLDSVLEEDAPAAGAVAGGSEGHTFIELLRIIEAVDPLSFQFATTNDRVLGAIDALAVVPASDVAISVLAPDNTNDNTPTISGKTLLVSGSTIVLTITDSAGVVQTVTTAVKGDGSFSVDVPQQLADGSYTVVAKGSDAAGNTGTASDNGSVDSTVPALSAQLDPLSDSGVIGDGVTDDHTPTISGTGEPGNRIDVTIPGTNEHLTTTVGADGQWTVTPTLAIPDGALTIPVVETDPVGNTTSTTVPVTIDTTAGAAPTVSITTDANNDGFLNRSEIGSSTSVAVRVGLPGGARVGDTLTLSDGTTVQTHVLTAADLGAGSYLT